jgi:hypothetical protein
MTALPDIDLILDGDDEDLITLVYDIAADCGQIVDNVKHMRWFRQAVADEMEVSHV